MPLATFDQVTFWVQAFIPMPVVEALGTCFHGDGRDFSDDFNESRWRVRSDMVISGFLSGGPEIVEFHQVGETLKLNCDTGELRESGFASTDSLSFHDFRVGNTFPGPEGGVVDLPSEETAAVLYDGETENPLALPSPDVDINLFFWVDPVTRTLSVRGAVNAFPDYEAYASVDGGPPITLFQHRHNLDPAFGLPGEADQLVSNTVQV